MMNECDTCEKNVEPVVIPGVIIETLLEEMQSYHSWSISGTIVTFLVMDDSYDDVLWEYDLSSLIKECSVLHNRDVQAAYASNHFIPIMNKLFDLE